MIGEKKAFVHANLGEKRSNFLYGFYPVEVVVIFFWLLCLLLYFQVAIPLRAPLLLYSHRIIQSLAFYLVGLWISFFFVRLAMIRGVNRSEKKISLQETWLKYWQAYLQRWQLVRDFRFLNAISLMFVGFINLKHLIPHINSTLYDPQFAEIERRLFGGKILSQVFIDAFPHQAAYVLNYGYTFFYTYVALLIFFFILQRDEKLTHEVCCVFVCTWFLGIMTVYVVPTLGPCFYFPELFSSLPPTRVTEMQAELWEMKEFVTANPGSRRSVYLISGLPSLHLAIPIIGSVYFGKINRLLGVVSWTFVWITALTTIYFGWHYLADDIASVVLSVVSIIVGKWCCRALRLPR